MTFLLMIKIWLFLGLLGYILTMMNFKKQRQQIESNSFFVQTLFFIAICILGLFSFIGGLGGFKYKKNGRT